MVIFLEEKLGYKFEDEIYLEKELWNSGASIEDIEEVQRRDLSELETLGHADELRRVGMFREAKRYLKIKGYL